MKGYKSVIFTVNLHCYPAPALPDNRFQRTLFAGQRAKLVYQHSHNDFRLYASRSANLIISCGMRGIRPMTLPVGTVSSCLVSAEGASRVLFQGPMNAGGLLE